jgi:hypothetical protein
MVGLSSGDALKAAVGTSATVRKNPSTPIMRDGDLDSDIVYHEYGHGLTCAHDRRHERRLRRRHR